MDFKFEFFSEFFFNFILIPVELYSVNFNHNILSEITFQIKTIHFITLIESRGENIISTTRQIEPPNDKAT